MFKSFFKKLGIGIFTFTIGVLLYLTLPLPSALFSAVNENFPKDEPVAVKNQKCSDKTLYVFPEPLYLSDNETVDECCYKLQRDLLISIEKGDIENVRNLLAEGANVNARGFPENSLDFITSLPFAVRKKQTRIVRLLLDNNGNVNDYYACCMTRESLLMIAIKNEELQTVKLLLARGADVNFKGYENHNALMYALTQNNKEIVYLLENACGRSLQCRVQLRAEILYANVIKLLNH